jgi:hypothetical protein
MLFIDDSEAVIEAATRDLLTTVRINKRQMSEGEFHVWLITQSQAIEDEAHRIGT